MPKNNIYSLNLNHNNDNINGISPIPKDNDNENMFYHPNVGGYKLFYNHYYQNYLNLKPNENNENQDKHGVQLYFNKINNNSNEYLSCLFRNGKKRNSCRKRKRST